MFGKKVRFAALLLVFLVLSGCDGIVLEDEELLDTVNKAGEPFGLTFEMSNSFPKAVKQAVLIFTYQNHVDVGIDNINVVTEVLLENGNILASDSQHARYYVCSEKRTIVLLYIPYWTNQDGTGEIFSSDAFPDATIGDRVDPELVSGGAWRIYCVKIPRELANDTAAHFRVSKSIGEGLISMFEESPH